MASNGHAQPNTSPPETTGLLAERFPVNSLQELTLQSGEAVSGRVYCTDEMTGSIVLQKALVHTTLASEIRIVAADSVTKSVVLKEDNSETDAAAVAASPLTNPLPKIQKKALEERERRAIRLAEESLRHINEKVGHYVWRSSTWDMMVEGILKSGIVGVSGQLVRIRLYFFQQIKYSIAKFYVLDVSYVE